MSGDDMRVRWVDYRYDAISPVTIGSEPYENTHARLRWARVVARLTSKHALYLGGVRVVEDKRVAAGEIWFPDDLRLGGF